MILLRLGSASILATCVAIAVGCSESSDTATVAVTTERRATTSITDAPATADTTTAPSQNATVDVSTTTPAPAATADDATTTTAGSACSPPEEGAELLDQDMRDHQVPWERKGADRVAIYFESASVTEEYRGYLEQGAVAWNRSPCLDVRIVDVCPADVNCVTVSLTDGDDADGNFDSIEEGDFTVGGHIDLFHEELDDEGDGAKLNVTIHEMGHAVGLRHRATGRVLMNGDTYTDIFDPDAIDDENLLVLYGNQT